jgi:hypothetical protein
MTYPEKLYSKEFSRMINSLQQEGYVRLPHDFKENNRINTLNALTQEMSLSCPMSPIFADGLPYALGPQTVLKNLADAYDNVIHGLSRPRRTSTVDDLFYLTIMLDSNRRTYGFLAENIIRNQCLWLMNKQSLFVPSEWQLFTCYIEWRNARFHFNETIGTALLLLILEKCFKMAPNIFPWLDFSQVISAFYKYGYTPHILMEQFSEAFYQLAASACLYLSKLPKPEIESELLPLLALLTDGPRSRQELMEAMGIDQRLKFTYDFLKPALEKQLILPTEDKPNNPNMKYQLSDAGIYQLQFIGEEIQ